MKAKLFLTTTLFVLLTGGFANVSTSNNFSYVENPIEFTPVNPIENLSKTVKAIVYKNEAIPYVELAEVQVVGKRNPEQLTKAKMIDGKIVSVIDLDEVIIRPNL